MPSAYKPGEYINRRFASSRIANRVVVQAQTAQLPVFNTKLIEKIEGPIAEAVEAFFRNLAGYMGKSLDLYTQLGPDAATIGLHPWNPLTDPYVQQKKTDQFFLYTQAPGSALARHHAKRRLSKKQRDQLLINKFQKISGDVFGGIETEVTAHDRSILKVVSKGRRKAVDPTILGKLRQFYDAIPTVKLLKVSDLTITIRLWAGMTKAEIPAVEEWLKGQGALNDHDVEKLLNRGLTRPLIRPYMAFYSLVLVPQLIRGALKNAYKLDITSNSRR